MPIRSVVSAMVPMMTRMAVTTGISLIKLSLVQRMMLNTRRRPSVKLTARKIAVPSTLWLKVSASTSP